MKIITPVRLSSDTVSFQHGQCPSCREGKVRRSQRKNTLERFLSLAYIYPFRCQRCGHRFFKLQWGVRYKKVFYGSPHRDDEEQALQPLIAAIDPILSPLPSYGSIIDSDKEAGNLFTQIVFELRGDLPSNSWRKVGNTPAIGSIRTQYLQRSHFRSRKLMRLIQKSRVATLRGSIQFRVALKR
jgi:hypothetical protein